MKTLKKSIKELLVLFIELVPTAIDEIKRTKRVIRGLNYLNQANLNKIQFSHDLSITYSNIRYKISGNIWENWIVRRIFYNFHIYQSCDSPTKYIYHDLLNYVKNIMSTSNNQEDYPLHKAVIEGKLYKIRQICIGEDINSFYIHIDQPDAIGNTALMLAVKLNKYDEVQVLIDHGADPKYRLNPSLACPIEQAIAMNDKEMLKKLVNGYHREIQSNWNENIEEFSRTLQNLPDFSLNMSWECISSFIPFLKRFTPSDEYYICKKGNNLKIDLLFVQFVIRKTNTQILTS